MIKTRCPECKKIIKADFKQRGHLGRCPHCGKKFTIEAVPWWENVGKEPKSVESAKESKEDELILRAHRPSQRRGGHGLYERVDIPDVPEHHGGWHVYAVVAVLVIAVTATVVGLVLQGGSTGRPDQPPRPSRPGAGPKPTEKKRPPKRRPAKNARQPKEQRPERPTRGAGVVEIDAEDIPLYGHELSAQIQMAGYVPVDGAELPDGDAYRFHLAGYKPLFFTAYAGDHRVICDAFLSREAAAHPGAFSEDGPVEAVKSILSGYLTGDRRRSFAQWAEAAMIEAERSKKTGRPFVKERRFGTKVVRCESVSAERPGPGLRIEIARAYKPSTEISGLPPVADWGEMRTGMTLREVSAFARNGRLRSRMGTDGWPIENYIWPDGGSVTLQNGRVTNWQAPPAPPEAKPRAE